MSLKIFVSSVNFTEYDLTDQKPGIAKTRKPSKRGSFRFTKDHQPDILESSQGNLVRKSSLKSLLSATSNSLKTRRRNSSFLGRHRTPSTPELYYPQRSSSFCVQSKFRSVSLSSFSRIPRHRKESLFIDVKSRRIFLKPTSSSLITPVNVRHRIPRQRGKKIPILTPLWIIRPQRNKELSSTGAMESPNASYTGIPFSFDPPPRGNGRIISVSDDVSYYSPTEHPIGWGGRLGSNFEEDLASLPMPPVNHAYVRQQQPKKIIHNQLERVNTNLPKERNSLKSFLKKLRERLACFSCFNSD
jgi:hypothetical protein